MHCCAACSQWSCLLKRAVRQLVCLSGWPCFDRACDQHEPQEQRLRQVLGGAPVLRDALCLQTECILNQSMKSSI